MQGCHGQGKISGKLIFSRSGKCQGTLWMAREFWKVREFENKWLCRQSSENLFILFKREKDSHDIV